MNFAEWFTEMEAIQGQSPEALPDPIQFSYIACVLDVLDQEALENAVSRWIQLTPQHFIPPGWTWRCHHMTVKPPGVSSQDMETYKPFFGQIVHLTVTEIVANDKCVAVKVKPDKSFRIVPAVPHITVAHSSEVKPMYSNELFTLVKSVPVTPLTLQSSFVAIKKDQRSEWPKMGFPMALPQKIK